MRRKAPPPPSFVVPGIGRVTPRRGENRAAAERRARRDHGLKIARKPVFVPGLGKVAPRARESWSEALERARGTHRRKSDQGFADSVAGRPKRAKASSRRARRVPVEIYGPSRGDDEQPAQEVLILLRKDKDRATTGRTGTLTVSGRIQKHPDFVVSEPFSQRRKIISAVDDVAGAVAEVIREIMESISPDLALISSVTLS